jgi:hypothetical protein
MVTILAVAVGVTVLVDQGLRGGTGSDDQVVAASTTSSSTTSTSSTTTTAPAPGDVRVTGTVTAVHLEGAVLDPRDLPTPLTVTADRGFGNGGRLSGVTVDGTPVTIEWDAGRPFVLSSGGALVVDPVRIDLTAEGLRLNLADGVHGLQPGTYHLDTPVALGSSGVAEARESVVFAATDASTFEPRGDAALFLGRDQPRRVVGPGRVHLEGALQLQDGAGTRSIGSLDAGEGAYDLTLTPAADGGWTVTALLGGEVTAT